jgi:hypothetical protein
MSITRAVQGCQMVCFQTKNPNLGQFWSVLDWKMLIYTYHSHLDYFIEILEILLPFGTFCAHSVHFSGFGYHVHTTKNLATLGLLS